MEVIKSGFEIAYTLGKDYIVKSTGAGQMDGRNYGASVKISTYNLYEKDNLKTEAKDEVMEEVTFKIPCEHDSEAGALSDFLRQARKSKEVLVLIGSLPNQRGEVSVINTPREILGLKQDEAKKVS